MVEQYTIPRIGSIKLTKLTSHDLQKLYKDLMENGRIDRKSGHGNPGLSSTTVRSLHLMLHNAFERAVKERLIPRNPTEDCIAPKIQKFEMQILQPEHIKEYLNAANARGLLPMFYLELVSGLRKGELTALLWSDLDIQNRTISVSKQYVKNPNGELALTRPKTETSVRKVSIPQEAVDLLISEHDKHPDSRRLLLCGIGSRSAALRRLLLRSLLPLPGEFLFCPTQAADGGILNGVAAVLVCLPVLGRIPQLRPQPLRAVV